MKADYGKPRHLCDDLVCPAPMRKLSIRSHASEQIIMTIVRLLLVLLLLLLLLVVVVVAVAVVV